MNVDQKIAAQVEALVVEGQKVIASRRKPAPNHLTSDFVDAQLASQWFTRALNLISRTVGQDSEHYRAMSRVFKGYPKWLNVDQGFGVFLAFKADIEAGALFHLKGLVAADMHADLLDQAKALLDAGYFAPSAVVIGCVLEDGLRRLCVKNQIALAGKEKLDWMNAALAKAQVYTPLTQKKITALADIRNSAAHGKWAAFTQNDVADMLKWTTDFLEKHDG